MILMTWKMGMLCSYKQFTPKCLHGNEGRETLTASGFKEGYYHLVCSAQYTGEDGNPKRVCVIRGPGCGNHLRDSKWNLDQFPDISEEAMFKIKMHQADNEDLFYMEWQDVMDHFEQLAVSHLSMSNRYKMSNELSMDGMYKFTQEDDELFILDVE
jgi:hypothetical protein